MGIERFEVFVRHLRIRVVSQGVVCVYSVGQGDHLFDHMCFFSNPCGYTLYIFSDVSFS